MIEWQKSAELTVVPKQEQTWEYTGIRKISIFKVTSVDLGV